MLFLKGYCELFEGMCTIPLFELRLRQFDYLINGADNLEVEFLINRRQATRFLRGDTKGTIEISF